jgi:hypothetical protein
MRDAKNRSKKQLLHARRPSSGRLSKKPEREPPPLAILKLDTIFDEIDLLEDDPPHRGVAMRNARFRPYWIQAEEKEWQGLWEKGVFKKWSRKDLLRNNRVFTSGYVYKLKRSAITGEVYRFKDRLIVRGFQMEKGVDFDDSFSPTPGLAVGRFMLSLAVANDYELHACDIEQAFLQADKLPEGVNGRYFIQPPPGNPDDNDRDVVYEVCRPLHGNPSSPRALHKTLDAFFLSEGFEHVGFEESVWVRPKGGRVPPLDTIFDEIDLLEDDPPHRGVAMRNARFRPYWIQAEEKEWQGLWEKGVFKKWSRKDLLRNNRVFTSGKRISGL